MCPSCFYLMAMTVRYSVTSGSPSWCSFSQEVHPENEQRSMRNRHEAEQSFRGLARAARRLPRTFSQGAAWKTLISKYIGTMPPSADPCPVEQSASIGLAPTALVSRAMPAKVGVAARPSHRASLGEVPSPTS